MYIIMETVAIIIISYRQIPRIGRYWKPILSINYNTTLYLNLKQLAIVCLVFMEISKTE